MNFSDCYGMLNKNNEEMKNDPEDDIDIILQQIDRYCEKLLKSKENLIETHGIDVESAADQLVFSYFNSLNRQVNKRLQEKNLHFIELIEKSSNK